MIGMPIVGLATTEMATVVENGVSGYVDTDVERLIERDAASCWPTRPRPGGWARAPGGAALERFGIDRFARDWDEAFADGRRPAGAAGRRSPRSPLASEVRHESGGSR